MALSHYEFCKRQLGRTYGCRYTVAEVSLDRTHLIARHDGNGKSYNYLIDNGELRNLIEAGFVTPQPSEGPCPTPSTPKTSGALPT